MQGFEKLTGQMAPGSEWAIAIPSVFAQFSLSENSGIIVLTKLLRYMQRPANATADKYEKKLTKKEQAILAMIPLGSLAAYKIGYDACRDDYKWSQTVSHGVGFFRFAGMIGVNTNYTSDHIKKSSGMDYSLPIVCASELREKKSGKIANSDTPLDFIRHFKTALY